MNFVDYFKRKFFSFKACNLLVNMMFNELIEIMKTEEGIFQCMPVECTLSDKDEKASCLRTCLFFDSTP